MISIKTIAILMAGAAVATLAACAPTTPSPESSITPPPTATPPAESRRVVTGIDTEGLAIIASDDGVKAESPAALGGVQFYRLWGDDEESVVPNDGTEPSYETVFPPRDGYRVMRIYQPPASQAAPPPADAAAAAAELDQVLPGLSAAMEPNGGGMHTTQTVDFDYVLSGTCIMELDEGVKVTLGPGDLVVQNGTRHAWSNPPDEPCEILSFLRGARKE